MTPGCKAKASTLVPSVLQQTLNWSRNCIVVLIVKMHGHQCRHGRVIAGVKADAER